MMIDSRGGGEPPRDMATYARLRLAELRADTAGEVWGIFVEPNQPLPSGLVLPLDTWQTPHHEP